MVNFPIVPVGPQLRGYKKDFDPQNSENRDDLMNLWAENITDPY